MTTPPTTRLQARRTPLATTRFGPSQAADRSDLAPVIEPLRPASIVGLGEVTHGTRECCTLKARLVRALVVDGGFRTVAFEADVAEMLAAANYVWSGAGDPETAVDALSTWQWQTAAVRDLLAWLRAFNRGRPPADRVRVRGVDLSDPAVPAASLADRLHSLAPDWAAESEGVARLASVDLPPAGADQEVRLDAVEAAATTVADWLDDHRPGGDAGSESTREWRLACALAAAVRRDCVWDRVRHAHEGPHPAGMAERDRQMADTARQWLDTDPGEGMILWAHNSHVQRGRFDDGTVWTDAMTMGERLSRSLGERYRTVGFDACRGSFRAVDAAGGDVETFEFGAPSDGSLTAALAGVDREDAGGPAGERDPRPTFVDLSGGVDPAVREWLRERSRIRWVGSVYDAEHPEKHWQDTDVAASYDGLLLLADSSPTRPLEA